MWCDRIIGSILIVFGLYSVLWGKHKENLETKSAVDDAHKLPQAIKLSSQPNNNNLNLEPNKLSNSLIISMPDPESPIKPNQNPWEWFSVGEGHFRQSSSLVFGVVGEGFTFIQSYWRSPTKATQPNSTWLSPVLV